MTIHHVAGCCSVAEETATTSFGAAAVGIQTRGEAEAVVVLGEGLGVVPEFFMYKEVLLVITMFF